MTTTARVPHVIVIGAGFAGLRAVRSLRNAPVRVTLIDRHNYQTFQPLLYQVATAGLNVADVAFPIRGVIRRYKNCSFRRAVVASVDHDRRVVHLEDSESLLFDRQGVEPTPDVALSASRSAALDVIPSLGKIR
jgi:NADH dehydrogenase